MQIVSAPARRPLHRRSNASEGDPTKFRTGADASDLNRTLSRSLGRAHTRFLPAVEPNALWDGRAAAGESLLPFGACDAPRNPSVSTRATGGSWGVGTDEIEAATTRVSKAGTDWKSVRNSRELVE